jgi:hypothetical protein
LEVSNAEVACAEGLGPWLCDLDLVPLDPHLVDGLGIRRRRSFDLTGFEAELDGFEKEAAIDREGCVATPVVISRAQMMG